MLVRPATLDEVRRYDERCRALDRAYARSRGAHRNRSLQRGASGGGFAPEGLANTILWLETRVGRGVTAPTWNDKSPTAAVFAASSSFPDVTASDANFAGQQTLANVSANNDGVVSDKAAATYIAGSNGAGVSWYGLFRTPPIAAIEVLADNCDYLSGTGFSIGTLSDAFGRRLRCGVSNAGGTVIDTLATGPVLEVSTKYDAFFTYVEGGSPEWALYLNGTLVDSGSSAMAPAAGNPTATLYLNTRSTGGLRFNGVTAIQGMWSRVLTAAERTQIRAYAAQWYGAPA